jgi:hypothetical protein
VTIYQKIAELQVTVRELERSARVTPTIATEYRKLRVLAMRAKREAQAIVSAARAGERRVCQHEPGEHGKRHIEDYQGARRVTRHYDCSKCGKRDVRVVPVTESVDEVLR